MKDSIKDIARQIARMSGDDISELESALIQNGIGATLYRFSPIDGMWDKKSDIYGVFMRKTGDRKLLLVKTIKEFFGMGLKEAKDIVNACPCVVREMSYELAEELKRELEACGATIEIHEA